MKAATEPVRRPRVGLVLGSGGIKCAAAVGLWKVLEREGIAVDVAVGCSGGSVYAAGMALGEDVASVEARTQYMWKDLFSRLHYRSVLRVMLPRVFGFSESVGLLDDRRIWRVMQSAFGDRTFADARLPLFLAATDLRSGEKVVLSEGRLADAVRASISLPILLRPWPVGGRLLVDGGASNPLPIDVAIREGCDVIIAMGFESAVSDQLPSMLRVARQTMAIATNHLLWSTFAFHSAAHHAELVPIIPIFDRRIALGDTSLIPYLIEQGERAAEAELPYLRRLLAGAAPTPSVAGMVSP
ncbi:MAG TPA: patatin-like phospholipase family protein [Gemmatimonadaceae bacterium]|jgi:NTE family protein|nr:patatin-like phospholipase family protein [Gemmatimonadaceae bacterium]